MEIKSTKNENAQFLKVLVHAPAGAGKTRLCATTGGKPLILSAEAGLLSLRGSEIDFVEIKTMQDLYDAYTYLQTDKAHDWVCIDSISEIAEVVLSDEKTKTKDPRKAYGEMAEQMTKLIRCFRDLPKNVYMSAKQSKVKDEMTGGLYYGPAAPGQQIANQLPYFFDLVFALHNWKDESGTVQRAFQTQRDAQYEAKDRSGALDFIEKPDLAHIRAKILNPTKGE